jgi:hypothetical protein
MRGARIVSVRATVVGVPETALASCAFYRSGSGETSEVLPEGPLVKVVAFGDNKIHGVGVAVL